VTFAVILKSVSLARAMVFVTIAEVLMASVTIARVMVVPFA